MCRVRGDPRLPIAPNTRPQRSLRTSIPRGARHGASDRQSSGFQVGIVLRGGHRTRIVPRELQAHRFEQGRLTTSAGPAHSRQATPLCPAHAAQVARPAARADSLRLASLVVSEQPHGTDDDDSDDARAPHGRKDLFILTSNATPTSITGEERIAPSPICTVLLAMTYDENIAAFAERVRARPAGTARVDTICCWPLSTIHVPGWLGRARAVVQPNIRDDVSCLDQVGIGDASVIIDDDMPWCSYSSNATPPAVTAPPLRSLPRGSDARRTSARRWGTRIVRHPTP